MDELFDAFFKDAQRSRQQLGSILGPLAGRAIFTSLGFELTKNSDEVALGGHHFADVFCKP